MTEADTYTSDFHLHALEAPTLGGHLGAYRASVARLALRRGVGLAKPDTAGPRLPGGARPVLRTRQGTADASGSSKEQQQLRRRNLKPEHCLGHGGEGGRRGVYERRGKRQP
jgi:hypothetical protein